MLKVISFAAAAAVALAVSAAPQPASARGGAIAAGVVGGLAVGAIVASQSNRNYYRGPGYYEDSSYRPVYGRCHTERQWAVNRHGHRYMQSFRVCD